MRLSDVARKFDCCPTLLKQHCRKLGIERWPYRTTKKVAKRRSRMRQRYGEAAWDSIESQIAQQKPGLLAPADSAATMLAGWRKIEEAAEELQGEKRRVKIWNKTKKRKTAGMAAPFASHLVDFLERNPDCEVYNGQDLVEKQQEQPELSISPRSYCESSRSNQVEDPMNSAWSISPAPSSIDSLSAPSSSESCELIGTFDGTLNSLPLYDLDHVSIKDLAHLQPFGLGEPYEPLSSAVRLGQGPFLEANLDQVESVRAPPDILDCEFCLDDLLASSTSYQGELHPCMSAAYCSLYACPCLFVLVC